MTSRPSAVIVDCSALSNLIAWRFLDPRRPNRRRSSVPLSQQEKLLARVHGKALPPLQAFETLWESFAASRRRIVTTNVLQELWKANLAAQLGVERREFVHFAEELQREYPLLESTVRFEDVWSDGWLQRVFLDLGLTDAGLCWLARTERARLLTEDLPLANEAMANDLEVLGASIRLERT